jgi:competence protein ComEC
LPTVRAAGNLPPPHANINHPGCFRMQERRVRVVWESIQKLVLVAVCAVASPAAAQDLVTPSDRVTSHVNVRSAPSISASEIDQLQVGKSAQLLGDVPRWYEIQLSDGRRGFISKAWTTVSLALAPRQGDELRIHFLNIGTGTCTVVECPGAGAPPMIVDCGSTGGTANELNAQETRDYIRNILAQHQTTPNVVLSHADVDHYSRIPLVLDDVGVASVWQGGDPDDYTSGNFPTWITDQEGRGAELHRDFPQGWHNEGQPVSDLSCGDASTFVLTVNVGTSKNAQSLVLMIEYQDFTIVSTGDAEGETEQQAIDNFPGMLKATVMTSSHHGASSEGSNSQVWAEVTAPEVLISSAGNRFFHPRCTATNRFRTLASTKRHDVRCGDSVSYRNERMNLAHYVTEVSGAIVVTSNGRSPLALHCTRSAECGVRIPHE